MNAGRSSGEPLTRLDGRALRRLPRLHGLRDGLPLRGAVRPAHRGHPAQVERRHERSTARQGAPRRRSSRSSRTRSGCRRLRGPLRALPEDRAAASVLRRSGLLDRLSPTLAAMEALAPRLGQAGAGPERTSAQGTPARRRRHAPRLRPARVLPRRQRGHRPRPRRRGLRRHRPARRRAAAARSSSHNGREEEAQAVRPRTDRGVRGGRRRRPRGQLGRLRVGDEGLRRTSSRTSPRRRSGRGADRQGPRRRRVPRRARARSPSATR